MIIVGMTGQSGSGKTTAAAIFERMGFYHLNCDRTVHTRVYRSRALLRELEKAFGKACVTENGICKQALGELVFSDKEAYGRFMDIIMPHVKAQLTAEISEHSTENILLDAPLLFEYGLEKICSCTVGLVSDCNEQRICLRDGISPQAARRRLANQKSADYYKSKCSFIIENNGTVEELEEKAAEIAAAILNGVTDR